MVNRLILCKECPFFKVSDNFGNGKCSITKVSNKGDNECSFVFEDKISDDQALKVLHYHQKWRRGYDGKMVNSKLLGLSLDRAIKGLRKVLKGGK